MKISYSNIFIFYRILFSLLLFFQLIPGITPGDSLSYAYGYYDDDTRLSLFISPGTTMLITLFQFLRSIVGPIGVYLLGTIISTYCLNKFILYNVKFLKHHERVLTYLFFSLPIFTVFTVGFTKETFIIIYLFCLYEAFINKKKKFKILSIILTPFMLFVKIIILLVPVVFILTYFIEKKLKNNLFDIKKFAIFIYIPAFILLFFLLKDQINNTVFSIEKHINFSDNTSRNQGFFQEEYDFLKKTIPGLFYVVFGVSFTDFLNYSQAKVILAENLLIITYLILMINPFKLKVNINSLYKFLFLVVIISIANYPLMVFNVVTAYRYKLFIILVLSYYIFEMKKLKYV